MRPALIALLACAAASLAAPADAQPTDAERRAAEWQANWERDHLCEAGFRPIAEVAATGVDLRRARYTEGMLALRMPGVTLERRGDGKVFVSLTGGATPGELRAEAPAEAWTTLIANDAAAFAPLPVAKPDPNAPPPKPPPICHGWGVTLEAAEGNAFRKAQGHGCSYEATKAAVDYGAALARLALDNIPECAAARARATAGDPFYALAACKGRFEPKTLDWRC